MPVLSMMSVQGDPDELFAKMDQTIRPIAERKAPEYGGISTTVVRTDDGLMIINMWETEEGRHQMADDPEVREAMQQVGFQPQFKGYEVLAHRTAAQQ